MSPDLACFGTSRLDSNRRRDRQASFAAIIERKASGEPTFVGVVADSERFRCEHHFVVDGVERSVYSFLGRRSRLVAAGSERLSSFDCDREPGRLEAERTVSAAGRTGGKILAEVVESLSQARAMSKRLYVGNLKYTVTSAQLQELIRTIRGRQLGIGLE